MTNMEHKIIIKNIKTKGFRFTRFKKYFLIHFISVVSMGIQSSSRNKACGY